MDRLQAEIKEEEWDAMSEEQQHDEAMENSEDYVARQQGWGAVLELAGKLVGKA
jgi:hypothetical protein